jgi:hypothetical protein
MRTPRLERALRAWLSSAARHADELRALRVSAEALADEPWDVVECAGALARAQWTMAETDTGLTARLRLCDINSPRAIARIPAGAPFPCFDRSGRQRLGAYDTPRELARMLVKKTLSACKGPTRRGLDPACGPGALLLAMHEAGIGSIQGLDLDPRAVTVARIALPTAEIQIQDGMSPGDPMDLVVGNPPYVPPERQNSEARQALRTRFPWLARRFDLAVPFSAAAGERVREYGGLGLIIPSSLLVEPYAAPLRRKWLQDHRLCWLSDLQDFPEVNIRVAAIVLQSGGEPRSLPGTGVHPRELLTLEQAPLSLFLRPGDTSLVERIRACSVELGSLCEVDTGVVSHGPKGGKARLLSDEPGPGRLPYVDAKDMQSDRIRWINYEPETMHRPKRLGLFSEPKLLIQRLRGTGPVQAWLDTRGLIAGHTLTVVRPETQGPPLARLLDLVRSPLVDALVRIERGSRLDLYPRDVASIPVPKAWLKNPQSSLEIAWGLNDSEVERLEGLARQLHNSGKPRSQSSR